MPGLSEWRNALEELDADTRAHIVFKPEVGPPKQWYFEMNQVCEQAKGKKKIR